MKKNYVILVLVAVVVLAGAFYFMSGNNQSPQPVTGQTAVNTSPVSGDTGVTPVPAPAKSATTGRVVFSVTDTAVGLDTVQSIMLTVNSISVQGPGGTWVSVSSVPQTFDLLSLYHSGKNQLFSDLNLTAGAYTQIRLSIGRVVVVQKDGLKNVQAKLPSQTLKFTAKVLVEKGKTSGVSLDFDSAKSLHQTGNGTLMFFPVVKLDTQHGVGTVQILGGNVQLLNGVGDTDQSWGVDASGNNKLGFSLDAVAKVELLGNVIHITPADEQPGDAAIGAQAAVNAAVQSGYITAALSVQTVIRNSVRVWQVVGTKGSAQVTVFLDTKTGSVVAVQ